MRFLKANLIVAVLFVMVGCTPAHEKPIGWHRTDGAPVDQSAFAEAMKKCDYIRASRTVTVDTNGSAFAGLMKAKDCMHTEGYDLTE